GLRSLGRLFSFINLYVLLALGFGFSGFRFFGPGVLLAMLFAFGPGFGGFRLSGLFAFGVPPGVTVFFTSGFPALFSFRFSRHRRNHGGRAFDADFERAFDFRVQVQFDFVVAERADRVFEVDLPLVERDVELVFQFVGDHAGGHRAEHLAVLARLDLDDADELGNALGEFGHGVR